MAGQHGGYRAPNNPAPVSGPGAHSARTDGGPAKMDLPNAKYGEAQNFDQIQSGASMSPASSGAAPAPQPRPLPVGLGEASQMPDQPVTAGADAGAGPGMDSLGLPGQSAFTEDVRKRLGPLLPWLIRKADDPQSSQELRDQVRFLIANL